MTKGHGGRGPSPESLCGRAAPGLAPHAPAAPHLTPREPWSPPQLEPSRLPRSEPCFSPASAGSAGRGGKLRLTPRPAEHCTSLPMVQAPPPRTWAPCDWLTRMAYLRWWAGRRRGLQGSSGEAAGWSGCPGEWVSRRGRGPHREAVPGPLLARLGLRSALCSRALSQHRAPPTSGLRLPGLRFWPQAARRLAWIGRQKRTVKTKSFIPSGI